METGRKHAGRVQNHGETAGGFTPRVLSFDRGPRTEDVKIPIEDSLDLHAFAPRDVQSVVEEYVTAAHEAGIREVRLIHGRGKGVQRGLVQHVLEKHPLVIEFWDAPESHLGATVARLLK
jgi:DNA-nicking Smr family endonuclease